MTDAEFPEKWREWYAYIHLSIARAADPIVRHGRSTRTTWLAMAIDSGTSSWQDDDNCAPDLRFMM